MEDSDALVGESILTLQTGFSHIYNPVNTKSRDTQVINTTQLEIAKKSMLVQKNSSWWASSWKPQTLKLRLWTHKLFASCGSEVICRFIVSWAPRPRLWRHQESTRRIIQNLAFVKFHPFAFFFQEIMVYNTLSNIQAPPKWNIYQIKSTSEHPWKGSCGRFHVTPLNEQTTI